MFKHHIPSQYGYKNLVILTRKKAALVGVSNGEVNREIIKKEVSVIYRDSKQREFKVHCAIIKSANY